MQQLALKIGFMTDQVPQQSRSRAAQDLRLGPSMDLNEPFHLGISRDIHDQIDAMVVDEIVDAVQGVSGARTVVGLGAGGQNLEDRALSLPRDRYVDQFFEVSRATSNRDRGQL